MTLYVAYYQVLTIISIFLQSPAQISQSVLTEAALQRHDQGEAPSPRHTFSGKDVTVNNRLVKYLMWKVHQLHWALKSSYNYRSERVYLIKVHHSHR